MDVYVRTSVCLREGRYRAAVEREAWAQAGCLVWMDQSQTRFEKTAKRQSSHFKFQG